MAEQAKCSHGTESDDTVQQDVEDEETRRQNAGSSVGKHIDEVSHAVVTQNMFQHGL